MKISPNEAIQLEAELSQEFRWSFDSAAKRTSCLVKITTDEGIVGWGECFGHPSLSAAVVRFLAPFLVGQSALATEKLWEFMCNKTRDQGRKGVPLCAISGIDIALWDVRGKYYNAPISQLLGGPMRTSLPAYATGTYHVGDAKGYDYIIGSVSRALSRKEFTTRLANADIAYGSINSVAALTGHAGLNRVRVATTKGTEVTMAAPPIIRSIDTDDSLPPPPKLGQHTKSVSGEFGIS